MKIIGLDTVGSTNDYARELARKGVPSGTVVWAHEQTAGRGRQGNGWVSERGNLFMSLILRPKAKLADLGQLSFLAAVALSDTLEAILPSTATIHLKWPNDVLLQGKKAAGILIESETSWVVIGIGMNMTHAPENAISLRDIGVKKYKAHDMLEFLSREIPERVESWEKEGFEPVRKKWLKRAYKLNKEISARLPKETLTGIFEGIDPTGALLLALPDGSRKTIASGEVFL
jgi:BirA family biotin operon repressor/biotin-[acetyl-CoA-carboxylase] ligase